MSENRRFTILVFVIYAALALFWLLFGRVNQDEGWYLYASKLVYRGQVPYRDFSYTQMPLLPYVYGLVQMPFGGSLLIGRLTSIACGLLALGLTMAAARRLNGDQAGWAAGALVCTNSFTIYYFTLVKTYALTGLLLVAMAYALARWPRSWQGYALALAATTAAVGVRLSVAPALICVIAYVLWQNRQCVRRLLQWTLLAIASAILLVVPYLLYSDVFIFNVMGHHLGKYNLEGSTLGVALRIFVEKAYILSEVVKQYFLVYTLIVASVALGWQHSLRQWWQRNAVVALLLVVYTLVFVANFVPGVAQDEYQTSLLPIAAIVAGTGWEQFVRELSARRRRDAWALLLAGCALAPIAFGLGRGTFSPFTVQGKTLPLAQVAAAGRFVNEHTAPDSRVLTLDTYVAIEAKRDVIPGLEMSIFSLYPQISTDQARRLRVMNAEILLAALESGQAKAVVASETALGIIAGAEHQDIQGFSSYSIEGSRFYAALKERYTLAREIPYFGQFGDTLCIYLPRE
ncbi:MAG: glycosyltransferase family 39 protein [Chloroflexi bacterium]|nr:glycosyltransferase family 39 protein [Chloroflexota bacterium]